MERIPHEPITGKSVRFAIFGPKLARDGLLADIAKRPLMAADGQWRSIALSSTESEMVMVSAGTAANWQAGQPLTWLNPL
jgi:hypothetical protein